MKNNQSIIRTKWYPIVIGLLSISTLGASLALIRTIINKSGGDQAFQDKIPTINLGAVWHIGAALFGLLVLLHMVQLLVSFRHSKTQTLKHLVYVILSGYAALLLIRNGSSATAWAFASLLYIGATFIGCVLSLIHKRSKWNVLLLILSIIILFFGVLGLFIPQIEEPELRRAGIAFSIILLFFLVDIQGIASIIPMAFSSIRMDVLKKIIRKTYAVEILSGIMLLIVAFSFILPAFEENISTFGDALWYCFAIVTTIGFGDITATSAIGRVLSVILGLYGIIVVSLITSIIVNFYGEMKKEEAGQEEEQNNRSQDSGNGNGNGINATGINRDENANAGAYTNAYPNTDTNATARKGINSDAGAEINTGAHLYTGAGTEVGSEKAENSNKNRPGVYLEEIDL